MEYNIKNNMPEKIVHITPVFYPYVSGMSNSCLTYAKSFAEKGYSVSVYTIDYGAEKARLEGIETKYFKPILKLGNAGFSLGLVKSALGLDKKTVLHIHIPFFGFQEIYALLLSIVLKEKKPKTIIQYHHDTELKGFKKFVSFFSYMFLKLLLLKADVIIVSSIEYAKNSKHLKKIWDKIENKIKEIPFGIDVDFYKDIEKTNVRTEKCEFLFVGSLDKAHDFKGIDVLIKALANIKKTDENLYNNLFFHIAGGGDLVEYYKNMSVEYGVGSHISFLGFVPDSDLKKLYRQCDAFLFPSVHKSEAFGIALLEAMAAGLPVLCSDLPGVVSVAGSDNVFFKTGDCFDLSSKIEYFYMNRDKFKETALKNRQKVFEKYDLNTIMDKIEKIYSL